MSEAKTELPVDRSDAVNLATNMLEHYDCKRITEKGVRTLCEAIIAMDSNIATATNELIKRDDEIKNMHREISLHEDANADLEQHILNLRDQLKQYNKNIERYQTLKKFAQIYHVEYCDSVSLMLPIRVDMGCKNYKDLVELFEATIDSFTEMDIRNKA